MPEKTDAKTDKPAAETPAPALAVEPASPGAFNQTPAPVPAWTPVVPPEKPWPSPGDNHAVDAARAREMAWKPAEPARRFQVLHTGIGLHREGAVVTEATFGPHVDLDRLVALGAIAELPADPDAKPNHPAA